MSRVKVQYGSDILAQNIKYLNSLKAGVRNSQIKTQAQKTIKPMPDPIAKTLPVKYGNDVANSNALRSQSLVMNKQINKLKSQAEKDIELEQIPQINPRFTNLSTFDENELEANQQQLVMQLCKKLVEDDIQAVKLFGLVMNDDRYRFFIKISPKLLKYANEELQNPTAENIFTYFQKLANKMIRIQKQDAADNMSRMSAKTENMLNTMNLAQSNIAESAKLEQDSIT
jgi:hypothetical protein